MKRILKKKFKFHDQILNQVYIYKNSNCYKSLIKLKFA